MRQYNMKKLKLITWKNKQWYVDGRLGELRNKDTFESIKFDDLEDDFNCDLITEEAYEYYNR